MSVPREYEALALKDAVVNFDVSEKEEIAVLTSDPAFAVCAALSDMFRAHRSLYKPATEQGDLNLARLPECESQRFRTALRIAHDLDLLQLYSAEAALGREVEPTGKLFKESVSRASRSKRGEVDD